MSYFFFGKTQYIENEFFFFVPFRLKEFPIKIFKQF